MGACVGACVGVCVRACVSCVCVAAALAMALAVSRLATASRTPPGRPVSMETPPRLSGEVAGDGDDASVSVVSLLLTELRRLGGGGGGPLRRVRTANDWLRPTGEEAELEELEAWPEPSGADWRRDTWWRPGRRLRVA